MFVVLEGADGVGKSTLCSVLAEKLGAVSYATPPRKYLERRSSVDRNASPDDHYRFYRDGIYDASDEISTILKGGGRVVCDRYWLTTYTYHRLMGVSVSRSDFLDIVTPTLTVILALNHDIQIKRMATRGMSDGDRRVIDKQREIAAAFCQDVLEFNIPFVLIDTQRFSPETCAEIVIRALTA